MPKKHKKYQQAISQPYFEPTQGSKLAKGFAALISRLFGEAPAGPSAQEIINYHFTQREREVAYLAALGFSEQEIAESLGMSLQAVRIQIHNALVKLDLNDVGELHEHFSPLNR